MKNEVGTTTGDSRSRLRRWWDRKTIARGSFDGHFFQQTMIRLGTLDRLLVAFGRDVIVETRTENDPPSDAFEAFGEMKTQAWTEPRRRRP